MIQVSRIARPDLDGYLNADKPFDKTIFPIDQMLPELPTNDRNGRLLAIPEGQSAQDSDARRNTNGTYQRIEFVDSEFTFDTYEYGLEGTIDNITELQYSDVMDLEMVTSEITRNRLMVQRAKRAFNAVTNSTVFTGVNNTLAVSKKWTADITAVPYTDVDNGAMKIFAKCGAAKSSLWLSLDYGTIDKTLRCTDCRDSLKFTSPIEKMPVNEKIDALRSYLGIGKVLAFGAGYNTALPGVDATFTNLWTPALGQLFIPAPVASSAQLMMPGLGYQPKWTKHSSDYKTETYDENAINGRVVRVSEYRGTFVNPKYGFLLSNLA